MFYVSSVCEFVQQNLYGSMCKHSWLRQDQDFPQNRDASFFTPIAPQPCFPLFQSFYPWTNPILLCLGPSPLPSKEILFSNLLCPTFSPFRYLSSQNLQSFFGTTHFLTFCPLSSLPPPFCSDILLPSTNPFVYSLVSPWPAIHPFPSFLLFSSCPSSYLLLILTSFAQCHVT